MQPRCEIGCLTDRCLLPRVAGTDRLAHYDEAGGYADPDLELLILDQYGADRRPHSQCGTHSPFCVCLLRCRPAEIDQHPIAHVARYEAAKPRDRFLDTSLISAK